MRTLARFNRGSKMAMADSISLTRSLWSRADNTDFEEMSANP